MKAEQLNEFNKKDFQDNEAHNLHTENAVEIAKAFGTPEEIEAMERIQDAHMRRGHILPNEIEERNALVNKYYSMLESSVNPTFRSTLEGYKILPPMDKEKYQARDGLEGPFSTLSGKVVYYDPKAGSYYDPDTDMYISYDDFQKLDNDYSDMKEEQINEGYEGAIIHALKQEGINGFFNKGTLYIEDGADMEQVNDIVDQTVKIAPEIKPESDYYQMEGSNQIDWPSEEMEQHAHNAIRHNMHAYDAYDHVWSNTADHREWMAKNREAIIQMFGKYGLSLESKRLTLSDIVKEKKDKEDYQAKKKALQDIQMDPHTAKDPELQKELMRRKAELEDERKKKINELDLLAPNTDYIKLPNGDYYKVNYRNTGTITGGGHKKGDLTAFKSIDTVSPDEIAMLDLDKKIADKDNEIHTGHDHQGGTPLSDKDISVYAFDTEEYERHVPQGIKSELIKFISRKNRNSVEEALTEEQFDEAAGEKDACYHKVKSRYKVWPSAYASGALVKCRKVGAKNWGNKSKK